MRDNLVLALLACAFAQGNASESADPAGPEVRRFSFSGYEWMVKTSTRRVGPGPNYFSNSATNVSLDARGRLRLRITHRDGLWQCAEVVSARSFGYGQYRFYIESVVNDLDANVVLGLFTWSDDPAFAHREIDFEFARWGDAADPNNAQYVVQPFDLSGHMRRYRVPASQTALSCIFRWETNRVAFWSLKGHSAVPVPTNQVYRWTFSQAGVPQPGDEQVRMNLWLTGGKPPLNGKESEVIIAGFEFAPLGPPEQPRVNAWGIRSNGAFGLSAEVELDRRYDIEASPDLFSWTNLGTVLATKKVLDFEDRDAGSFRWRFYRLLAPP